MDFTRKQFEEWGRAGGKKAALGMSKRQRKVRAKAAALARYAKVRLKKRPLDKTE